MSDVEEEEETESSFLEIASVSGLRARTTFVRALLDELERLVPSEIGAVPGSETLDEERGEDLLRLGARCIEMGRALAADLESGVELTRSECSAAQDLRGEEWNSRKVRGERPGMTFAEP
jgi:hypothetical protein